MKGFIWIAIVAGMLVIGCKGSQSLFKGYEQTDRGFYYQVHTKQAANAPHPKTGDFIWFHLETLTMADSIVFSTYTTNEDPIELQLMKPEGPGDVLAVIPYMTAGDSATIIMSADSIYDDGFRPDYADSGTWLKYNIKLFKFSDEASYMAEKERQKISRQQMQQKEIEAYLVKKNITNYSVTPEGLFVYEVKPGTGKTPTSGDKVEVHYTLKKLNGQKIESSKDRNQPFSFILDAGQVIKGWDIGLKQIKEGGTSVIILPSDLAYGERGAGASIPPNTPLLFEIELLNILDEKNQLDMDRETIQHWLNERSIAATEIHPGLFVQKESVGGEAKPRPGQMVTVHYKGTFLNGYQFDSSYDRGEPITFPIGQGRVIKGWDLAIPLFGKGGKGRIFIASPLAYGSASRQGIPTNSILVFDIELIDFQ